MTLSLMPNQDTLTALPRLVGETRAEFRKMVLEFVEQAAHTGAKSVAIDLSPTQEVDASGLGILVLVQKRAKELGVSMVLTRVPQQVRYLLLLTKLDHLFEFGD